MPERLTAVMRAITATTEPDDILDALDNYVGSQLQLTAIWPRHHLDHWDASLFTGSVLYHQCVDAGAREQLRVGMETFGPSVLAVMAAGDPAPFTFTEAMQRLQPSGSDRWIFELLLEHGLRDGLYCPQGSWMVAFASPKVLTLSREARMRIDLAANLTIYRLKELAARSKITAAVDLSPRELTVLRHLAAGEDTASIAERMTLSENSVRTYLKRAQKKLGAKSQVHAAALAIRQRLI
jgi:DNA-binding CsgD family transcriptional regulator